MKIKYCLISILLLSGCYKDPEAVEVAGKGYNVGKLFVVDGCSVYRFYDGGRYVYFSSCTGNTQSYHQVGKISITDNVKTN